MLLWRCAASNGEPALSRSSHAFYDDRDAASEEKRRSRKPSDARRRQDCEGRAAETATSPAFPPAAATWLAHTLHRIVLVGAGREARGEVCAGQQRRRDLRGRAWRRRRDFVALLRPCVLPCPASATEDLFSARSLGGQAPKLSDRVYSTVSSCIPRPNLAQLLCPRPYGICPGPTPGALRFPLVRILLAFCARLSLPLSPHSPPPPHPSSLVPSRLYASPPRRSFSTPPALLRLAPSHSFFHPLCRPASRCRPSSLALRPSPSWPSPSRPSTPRRAPLPVRTRFPAQSRSHRRPRRVGQRGSRCDELLSSMRC